MRLSEQSSEFGVQKDSKVASYRDLVVWQKSVLLVKAAYQVVNTFPKTEMYALTSQIKRSSVSVASNLAEGSSKRSTREFIRFLNMSYGSLAELEAQLIIAHELQFITADKLGALLKDCAEIGRMLNGLIRSLTAKLQPDTELRTPNSDPCPA